jgi:hypothetical protein
MAFTSLRCTILSLVNTRERDSDLTSTCSFPSILTAPFLLQIPSPLSSSSYSNLWQLRTEQDYWCAGAYLINKAVMKPYIDALFSTLANDWIGVSVVAGDQNEEGSTVLCCDVL